MHDRLLSASIGSVVTGALTLYPIWRGPRWVRAAYVALPAAAAGVVMTSVLRRKEDRSPARTAVCAGAAAGGIGTASWASIKLDKGIEMLVAKTGTKRPRVAMAVGAAALTALLEYADERLDGTAADDR